MIGDPKWISKPAVLAIHERLLAEHGDASGIIDEGLLHSALDGPKNQFAHGERDPVSLAAASAYALTQNHRFVDGNKRVAILHRVPCDRLAHVVAVPPADSTRVQLPQTAPELSGGKIGPAPRMNG